MRNVVVLLAALCLAGCASVAYNQPVEPKVVDLVSAPDRAAVEVDCGEGRVAHGTTPMHVEVPPPDERCSMTITADGYRPLHVQWSRSFVHQTGEPLRDEEHHELDPNRANIVDVILFPIQKLGDKIQNAAMRKIVADWRVKVKLMPL